MKKLKLNIMAIIGMMVAVGTVAFTAPEKKTDYNAEVETWFYQSQSTAATDINNPLNYSPTPLPGVECGRGPIVCSIQSEENPSMPGKPLLEHGDVTNGAAEYSITQRQ